MIAEEKSSASNRGAAAPVGHEAKKADGSVRASLLATRKKDASGWEDAKLKTATMAATRILQVRALTFGSIDWMR